MEGKLLTAIEVSAFLGCSKALIYRLIVEGKIPSIRISHRSVRVRPQDLETYIRVHTNSGGIYPSSADRQVSDSTKLGS
jgi:excisionase family DNA binding protein